MCDGRICLTSDLDVAILTERSEKLVLFKVVCRFCIGTDSEYAPHQIPLTMVGNDEIPVACSTLFNPVGLRLCVLIVEASVAGDRHPGDISQGNPAISARFLLRVVQANVAVNGIVPATRGIDTVTDIVDAGVVGNHVVLVAAVCQPPDAVPTISVKGAFADN